VEKARYAIAVRTEQSGRGGSVELGALSPGTELQVSLPRNHFPLADGQRHVLVAGGIGITPFLSMLPVLMRRGLDWHLHVCTRDMEAVPCSAVLAPFAGTGRIEWHFSKNGSRLRLQDLMDGLGTADQLYCCGPARMLDDVISRGRSLGDRLHVERFGFDGGIADAAYEVVLARSGRAIPVARGETMLQALRVAGVDMPASCEGGVCLECKTRYLEGAPMHRDLVMPAAERGQYLTPCVSGCASERLVLDL
jgi:vanillate O-demethylase ferredoxin subunit